MNERIRELLEQAGVKYVTVPKDTVYEKFAELIVQECVSIVQPYMSRWEEDHDLTKRIKEHFRS